MSRRGYSLISASMRTSPRSPVARQSMGTGRGSATRTLSRSQGAWAVPHRPDHRRRRLLDRYSGDHHRVQGGENSHQGHGPVDVDAVLFWKVIDPKKAALDVADYASAINWAAQTALRDVIGKTLLSDMLEGREKISDELRRIIDVRTEPWGINVISVEVKDVLIPSALEDAMSMQAQAERERQARVILGDSERQIAEKFGEAAKTYADNPTAFHLRAMNMLYEGLKKENATIVIVPSTAVETMQLGGLAGVTALSARLSEKAAPEPAVGPWSGAPSSELASEP
jgi:regulator of protease activity HflC (stomatin/prohibitin superfamily)